MKQYLLKRIGVFVSFIFVNGNVEKRLNLNEIKLIELFNKRNKIRSHRDYQRLSCETRVRSLLSGERNIFPQKILYKIFVIVVTHHCLKMQ